MTDQQGNETAQIEVAAREMIERYGRGAIAIARQRVDELEKAGQWPPHALALRVLTAVEKLLEQVAGDAPLRLSRPEGQPLN